MHKLNKILMSAGILLFSSTAFLSCSDDGGKLPSDMLGATFIQAITAGTDYVDLRWTITPTSNVEGYKVQIFTGTIGNLGSEVTSGTFDNKTATGTFTGLQPDTKYVAVTQCIPASGSGFSKADVAYFEFWTAPNVTPTSVTAVVTPVMDEETGKQATKEVPVVDEEGEPVLGPDGKPLTVTKPVYNARVTVNWMEDLNIQQVNNLYIYLADVKTDTQVAYLTTPAVGSGTTGTSYTFEAESVDPGELYYVEMWPNPSNYSWFTTASVGTGYMEFTMPDAE